LTIPFIHDLSVTHEQAVELSPLVRVVTAANEGPYTYTGTGSFIVGRGRVAIIDPGPDTPAHIDALLAATKGEDISHILVTHTHRDHSPAARPLSEASGAPILAFSAHGGGRHAGLGGEQVEEGADYDFQPHKQMHDGDSIGDTEWRLEAVYTPGHTSNHLCFYLPQEKTLFTGDHVMGWATSVIIPPDGDMALYMESLNKLLKLDLEFLRPCHGAAIPDPKNFIKALISHRKAREQEILGAVAGGLDTVAAMVENIYAHVPEVLHPAASRSALAHLIDLIGQKKIICKGSPTLASRYEVL
jgi:glyoxylase-like metal-dependent hydrolase (beta-lactamase superfamily II)